MSKNDITLDDIRTRVSTENYRSNFDRIFRPKVAVLAWPDGTWCYRDDYLDGKYRYRSDNFTTLHLSICMTVDEVDAEVAKFVSSGSTAL